MAKPARKPTAQVPGGKDHPLLQAFDAVQQAEKLRRAGKLDRARSVCANALKQYPDYVAALHTMGLILADQSQYDKALEQMHRAMMLNPVDPKILTGLSGVYLRVGSHLMAARTLEQAVEVGPKDVNVLMTLGEIYREQKEYELSKEAYEAALEIEPGLMLAEIGLARNLSQIGQLKEAAQIYERHVRQGSRALAHLYALGDLPSALVNIDIIPLLEEAKPTNKRVAADEFKAQLAFARAIAFNRAGRFEEAWEQVNRARRYKAAENKKA